jgi:hypothetical protein
MEFIEKLMTRQDLVPYKQQIEDYITKSGCVELKFETLNPKSGGVSIPGQCIVSDIILQFPKEVLLYILFHEVAHQYQYRKHGKNLMMKAYTELPIEEAVDELLWVESIADRLAMLSLRSIIGGDQLPEYRYYGCTNKAYFEDYLVSLRHEITQENAEGIEAINDIILRRVR